MSHSSNLARAARVATTWCAAYALWLTLGVLWFDDRAHTAGGMLVASVLALWADHRRPRREL